MKPGDPPRYARLLEDLGDVDPFADPAAYDLRYTERTVDVAFYRRLVARLGGRVLEVGCGNGRILVPLAADGREVWGIDRSAPLLDDLRDRLGAAALPAPVYRADLRTFSLDARFEVVLAAFNTVLHLYTRADFEAFLVRVAAHLAPGGRLVFDASVPRPAELARDPRRWYSSILRGPDGQRIRHREQFAYEPLEQILYVTTVQGEPPDERTTLLVHRQWYPAELEAILHHNGFAVEEVFADFGDEPPDLDADSLVWVCSRR